MKFQKALFVLLLFAQLASAQEEAVAPEPLELPADVAAQLDVRLADIEASLRILQNSP